MFFGSVQIVGRLDSQSKFQMFTLFTGRQKGRYWKKKILEDKMKILEKKILEDQEVFQHGGSTLILPGTFRRVSHFATTHAP